MRRRVTLVMDGHNVAVRAAKATAARSRGTDEDPYEVALQAFAGSFRRYVRDVAPTAVVVCWDAGHARRKAVYEHYKAARKDDDGSTNTYINLAREYLDRLGVCNVSVPGEEGDDLVAAYKEMHGYDELVIVSGDKDLLQLLDARMTIIRPGDDQPWGISRVKEKYGCSPARLPLLWAITGDLGDNVPGVPGYGVTRARKALEQVGWDLDRLLASNDRLKPYSDDIRRNLTLVDLRVARPDLLDVLPMPRPLVLPTGAALEVTLDWLRRHRLDHQAREARAGILWEAPHAVQRLRL